MSTTATATTPIATAPDNTTKKNAATLPVPPDCYIPDNFDQLIASKVKTPDAWLDNNLKEEIQRHLPTTGDIGADGSRDAKRLAEECGKILYPDRVFCCKNQVTAMMYAFCEPWAFTVVSTGQSLKCSFAKPDKPKKSGENSMKHPSKKRTVTPSLKETIQCPFYVNFSYLPTGEVPERPRIRRPIKVTTVCLEHTCSPAPDQQQRARRKSGWMQPDLEKVRDIVTMLRNEDLEKPSTFVTTTRLRELLKSRVALPYRIMDHQFLANFRARAALYKLDGDNPKHKHCRTCKCHRRDGDDSTLSSSAMETLQSPEHDGPSVLFALGSKIDDAVGDDDDMRFSAYRCLNAVLGLVQEKDHKAFAIEAMREFADKVAGANVQTSPLRKPIEPSVEMDDVQRAVAGVVQDSQHENYQGRVLPLNNDDMSPARLPHVKVLVEKKRTTRSNSRKRKAS